MNKLDTVSRYVAFFTYRVKAAAIAAANYDNRITTMRGTSRSFSKISDVHCASRFREYQSRISRVQHFTRSQLSEMLTRKYRCNAKLSEFCANSYKEKISDVFNVTSSDLARNASPFQFIADSLVAERAALCSND